MGLAESSELVARAVPKLAMVSSTASEEDTNLTVRMLSMGRFHPAVPVTGSVALTLAAGVPGTIVHDLARGDAASGLRLGTPAGCVTTFVEEHDSVPVVGVIRTYDGSRRIRAAPGPAPPAIELDMTTHPLDIVPPRAALFTRRNK